MERKNLTSKVQEGSDENEFQAIITTDSIDRDHEVVMPGGVQWEPFLKDNPTIPFGHDGDNRLPVGRAMWIKPLPKRSPNRLLMGFRMGSTPFAEDVATLIKEGILNTMSIGFEPLEGEFGPPTEKEIKKRPELAGVRNVYRKSELVEVSVVTVPSNRDALIQRCKSMSQDTRDLLEVPQGEAPIVVPIRVFDKAIQYTVKSKRVPFSTGLTKEAILKIVDDKVSMRLGRIR